MKFIACIVFAAVLALVAAEEGDREERSAYAAPSYAPAHAGPAKSYTYPSPAPAMPCGKNLLFSCAPSVAPVPCSAPAYSAPSYSAPAGAYSQYSPRYALPSGAPAYPQFAQQYPAFNPYY